MYTQSMELIRKMGEATANKIILRDDAINSSLSKEGERLAMCIYPVKYNVYVKYAQLKKL